ncbi:MAG: transcription termination/antitermination protein NusA [Candidatus Pacebacteria bacterium]|jgi:N utilization substance protein A|nr:transcription termination/antitermination protein NusA [Candidatus Paceibacterota bacterium]
MLDIKALKLALEQLETERRIGRDKLIDAIEQSLAAAYKKEYGKKGQVVRASINLDAGTVSFEQVKTVVDDTLVRFTEEPESDTDEREHYSEEKHILLDDARIMKTDAAIGDEIAFSLEPKEDFGRIAAQTAKQVIMQRIREAERTSILDEFGTKEGDIISGHIQKVERGMVYVDFNRATGVIPPNEQIPGERYVRGARIRGYLYHVEESPRGITLRISRTHPKFLEKLFAYESPEVASGVVVIKAIAREPGSRSKIAVWTEDGNIDPVGSCVGQKGVRVSTVMNELGGEKIDIIEWSPNTEEFIQKSLSPAKVLDLELIDAEHKATIEVTPDQLSLAIGKGGQNVRLAAKLTGWKIDIKGSAAEAEVAGENIEGDDFVSLDALKTEPALTDTEESLSEEQVLEEIPSEVPVETDNEADFEGITTGEIITEEIEGKD